MSARWVSLLAWAAVAASAVFWGLRVFVQPPAAPPQARLADPATAMRGDLTRLLGADAPPAVAAPPAADPRYTLVGVVSPRDAARGGREGVALIATDGRPPRAYRVGATVDGDHVLLAVSQRGAQIGPRGGPPVAALELPPPAPAATGRPGAGGPSAVPGLPRVPQPGERRGPGDEGPDPVQSAESSEDRPPQALPATPIGPATR